MLQNKIITSCLLLLIAVGGFFGSIEDGKYNTITSLNANVDGNPNVYSTSKSNAVAENGVNKPEPKCEGINCVAMTANSIFQIVTIIVSPAILLASWLMSPDWTSGDLFGLRGVMYKLWVTVSNIIYFVYAILLIIIALGTIFGNEKFGYKAMLPRLALGIIMVPFTWWFVQWTVSLATVVTASVMTIPMEMVSGDDNSFMKSIQIPRKIEIVSGTKLEESADTVNSACTNKQNSENCISLLDVVKTGGGMYGSLLGYAYGVFQVQDFKNVNTTLKQINQVGDLANQVILGVLFFVVFGVLVLALIFMLMMRAIKLWMYAIFSPLFTVHFVLGKDMLGEKMGDFNIKEFIGLCFVPAVVGITLSFGLIVISAIKGVSTQTEGCSDTYCKVNLFGTTENSIQTLRSSDDENGTTDTTTIMMGGVSFHYIGKVKPEDTTITGAAKGGLGVLGSLFGTIIIDIIALIFIWVAFMAAKGTSKAVGKAIEPFENMGKKVGELGASLPKYTPLPIPGGSVAGMNRTLELGKQKFDSKMREKEEEQIGSLFPGLVQGIIQEKKRMEAQGKMKDKESTLKESGELLQGAKDNSTNASKLRMTQEQANRMVELTEHIKKDVSVQSDEKLKKAFDKYLAGKTGEMNEYEIKSVFDYFRKYGSGGNKNNATNSQSYTAKEIIGKKDRMEVNIGDIRFDAKIDGTDIQGISDDEKKKLGEIMKEVTEDKFKERFSGLESKTVNAIIEELKKDGRKFKDK